MIALAALGAALGAALFAVLVRLVPPQPSVLVQLGRFDARRAAPNQTRSAAGGSPAGVRGRLGGLAAAVAVQLDAHGVAWAGLRQDLALTGRAVEALIARQLLGLGCGFLLVTGTAAALATIAGLTVPPATVAASGLLLAVGFALIPLAEAKQEAAGRRRDFRRAMGAYFDLVALEMAGSAAPAEALPNAARVGSGWPLALLRHTLAHATLAGRDPWQALTDLGERIGVTELRDLGGLVQLVGRDGARVRATLTARAATIRRRELADAEALAGRRDQSMIVAQTLIGFGFIVFVGYPAIVNLLAV